MTTSQAIRFADLGLREEILRAIGDAGYETPTAIQARAIPEVLAGRDVVGIAQTGTGKTASFVLPMLHLLAAGRARARMPRSLILSPTRELATQTSENFDIYGKHLNLNMALLIGGVGMGEQEKALEKGVDVLIATPGRLLDWFDRGKILLGGVNIMVIDEADRMLDMGFIPDVERIIQLMTMRKQTLLFSATMPKEIRRLADRFLSDPLEVEVARPAQSLSLIKDVLVPLGSPRSKRDALVKLLDAEDVSKAIIFCNRKRDVSSLMRYLKSRGRNASDLHGDLEQREREATLSAFKAGAVDLLVATDVAARGLDISDMPVVVNYDVPFNADDYVHRIGRTGRAGREGRAFTLTTDAEDKLVDAIEKITGRVIERHPPRATAASSGKPRAASEQSAAEERAGEDRQQKTVEGETGERAAPKRARRTRKPAAAATEAQESASPAARDADEKLDAASEASAGDRRGDDEPVRERGGRPARAGSRGTGKESTERSGRRRRDADGDRPVVGMGDHMPAFLLRPVPLKASVSEGPIDGA